MNITLAEMANRLPASDDAAMAQLKALWLRDPRNPSAAPEYVVLDSAAEVAHFIAIAAVVASQSNGKDELRTIVDTVEAADRVSAFEGFGASSPYQALQRTPKGDLLMQAGLPVVELDARKVAQLFSSAEAAFAALRAVDLGALTTGKGFLEALASRVSHPTKLSAAGGRGGFLKSTNVPIPPMFESITEEDFLTRETATLSCTAGFQKAWPLMLALVSYAGKPLRIAQLLAHDEDLSLAVVAELEAAGIQGAGLLIAALRSGADNELHGEPQVFAGDLPNTERLSVLAPFGLFSEISRAKAAVAGAYEIERDVRVADLDARIAAVDAEVATGAATPASTKAEKQTAMTRKKELAEVLRVLKNERKSLASKYLTVPTFSLMIGGAVPRNVAMDLDTSLHTANVLVTVPTVRKVVDAVSRQVFNPAALLATPRVHLASLPRFLTADAQGASLTRARKALFLELIVEVMEPLQAAREEWAERSKELSDEVALSQAAQISVDDRDDAYGLFIKGDVSLNQRDAKTKLNRLFKGISDSVKTALKSALPDMPATHDIELLELVTNTVLQERA